MINSAATKAPIVTGSGSGPARYVALELPDLSNSGPGPFRYVAPELLNPSNSGSGPVRYVAPGLLNPSNSGSGPVRYVAPGLLNPSNSRGCRPSKESDVYSLGMTAFQVHSSFIAVRLTGRCLIPWLGSLGGHAVR